MNSDSFAQIRTGLDVEKVGSIREAERTRRVKDYTWIKGRPPRRDRNIVLCPFGQIDVKELHVVPPAKKGVVEGSAAAIHSRSLSPSGLPDTHLRQKTT